MARAAEAPEAKKDRASKIMRALEREYPDAKIALNFTNPLELLVATILAAQCTDERVNTVTRSLFQKYRTAKDYALADPDTFEREIHSTGFYKSKARAILKMAAVLNEKFNGDVPRSFDDLVSLPGVGRKTANVVLGNAFGQQAIAVDTHVFRVSQRLGLAQSHDPETVHDQLCRVLPRAKWTASTHLLTTHGRQVCRARTPSCPACPIRTLCPWLGEARR